MESISVKDFHPWNTWKRSYERCTIGNDREWRDIHRDTTTDRIYLYQSKEVLREKHGALLVWTVVAHVIKIAKRTLSILTLNQLTIPKQTDTKKWCILHRIKQGMIKSCKDVLKIALTPILVVSLEGAAFYGLFNPYDGRKLYASFERLAHSKFKMEGIDIFDRTPALCAPCFQPNPTHHAMGGDIANGEAW